MYNNLCEGYDLADEYNVDRNIEIDVLHLTRGQMFPRLCPGWLMAAFLDFSFCFRTIG